MVTSYYSSKLAGLPGRLLNSFRFYLEKTVTDRLLLAFQVSNPAAYRPLTTLVTEPVSLASQAGNVFLHSDGNVKTHCGTKPAKL
jgi:hypothetical protein